MNNLINLNSKAMRKLKSTIILTLFAALLAMSNINAQAVRYDNVMTFDCDPTIWCIPEPGSGEIVYNELSRYDKDGNLTGWHYNLKGGKITGCETGIVYKLNSTGNSKVEIIKNNDQAVYVYSEKLKFTGPKGVKYVATWKAHRTINANGEVKVDYFEINWCE